MTLTHTQQKRIKMIKMVTKHTHSRIFIDVVLLFLLVYHDDVSINRNKIMASFAEWRLKIGTYSLFEVKYRS